MLARQELLQLKPLCQLRDGFLDAKNGVKCREI
jgi:hypothetical protein